ncbi:hypothetical protein AM493_01390 [Flavobacterium akiainvivens]|uniref:histidine kinase n=1 Tax=Flavobacterium akiainvivens TaxID=1202724 RepID=A0A0M8M8P8_9FLAO|nr:histidine kinase dimerization/phosphoacceptor domain -containing protein [Flavobacterium akiainvivens]KOS04845.1 hypothetical protein AM493_01390 [Flavobacterium akiainvivens]SFQ43363.1 Two-component sensor histidine kinase, contains HisKA and HATPase domains [Flavobacterium akiainvivens]
MKYKVIICFFFFSSWLLAQDKAIDANLKTIEGKAPLNKKIEACHEVARLYIERSGELKKDLDSANLYLQRAQTYNKTVRSDEYSGLTWILFSKLYRESGETGKATPYLKKTFNLATKTGSARLLAEYWFEQCYYYPSDQITPKIAALEKSVAAFENCKPVLQHGRALSLLSEFYLSDDSLAKALDAATKSLDIYTKVGEQDLMTVYFVLCCSYGRLLDHERSIAYGLKAARLGEQRNNNASWLSVIYYNVGLSYLQSNHDEEGIKYLYKALEQFMKEGKVDDIYTLTASLIHANYFKTEKEATDFYNSVHGKYAPASPLSIITNQKILLDIDMLMNRKSNARRNCALLQQLAEKYKTHEAEVRMAYLNILNYQIWAANKTGAREYYNRFSTFPLKNYIDSISFYSFGYRLAEMESRFGDAIRIHQQYDNLLDKVEKASKGRVISEMMVLYDIEQKDHALAGRKASIKLLEQQKMLQLGQLRQKNIANAIVIVFTVLSALFVCIVYLGYKAKKAAGLKLTQKNTEIKIKNRQLKRLVNERQWLLQEIHRRVKNNLQIIMSLLSSQSESLTHKQALSAIQNSRHRVQSMALIHNKLYSDKTTCETINIGAYIRELVEYLENSFTVQNRLTFILDAEDLEMDVSFAVPVGLIVNEAVTNAIKYAFPGGRKGQISISLKNRGDHTFILRIADDGIGLPAGFDITKSQSLGLRLIRGLSKDLEGSFTMVANGGTAVQIEFTYNFELKRNKSVI